MVSPARDAAWRALLRLRAGGRLDESLAGIPELEGLGPRDRGLANELVTGTVKRRLSVDAVIGAFTKAPVESTEGDVLEALRLAAFQMLFLDRVPAHAAVDDSVALLAGKGKRTQGFANAVLRKVAARGPATFAELAAGDGQRAWTVRHSCPRWIVRLLREDLGDVAAERFLVAANTAPERCLRVNTLRAGVADTIEALAGDGLATSAVPELREALLYSGPALERSAPFREGLVTPQSRGSQLVGRVVAEGLAGGVEGRAPLVLDLCAAPGTKTSQLAASLPGGAGHRPRPRRRAAGRPAREHDATRREGDRGGAGRRVVLACGLSRRLRRRAPRRSVQRSRDAVVAPGPALAAARRRRAEAGRSAAPHDRRRQRAACVRTAR